MLQSTPSNSTNNLNRYNLKFFYDVETAGDIEEIKQTTIQLINNLAKRVGAPNYQKTPIFKKKHKHTKKNDLANWNEIRNFKVTKLEKKLDDTNIIIDKFNIPMIIDYDTITIWVILEDTSQYFYSLLAHWVQMNQVEEYFNIINKEFKISKKDQILYLERTLLDTLLLFSLENENKYFIDNNLSTVKQIISILNKDFKYEL